MSQKSPLTPKQKRTLDAIRSFHAARGYMPSVRELMRKTGVALGTVHHHLTSLEAKGWIRRKLGPRSIEITESSAAIRSLSPVSIIGTVVSGKPLRRNQSERSDLSLPALGIHEKSFAVRVRGNRWAKFHILDADVIIVSPQAKATVGTLALTTPRTVRVALKRVGRRAERRRRHALPRRQRIETTAGGVVTAVIRALV